VPHVRVAAAAAAECSSRMQQLKLCALRGKATMKGTRGCPVAALLHRTAGAG
jgi:hypothetical protein